MVIQTDCFQREREREGAKGKTGGARRGERRKTCKNKEMFEGRGREGEREKETPQNEKGCRDTLARRVVVVVVGGKRTPPIYGQET